MNDLLLLHIHKGPGGDSPVAWSVLTPLIEQMEELITEAAGHLIPTIAAGDFVAGRSPSATRPPPRHRARLLLAGPPRRGSIVLPFVVELPVTFNIAAAVTTSLPGGVGSPPSALSEFVGTLADLATLAMFVREMVFGDRGLLARRTGQLGAEVPATREGRAIEESAKYLDALLPSIERLLEKADATGCEKLEVQVNDQARINLVMEGRRRRSSLLAQANAPVWGSSTPPPAGYFFDPGNPGAMRRAHSDEIEVEYQGRKLRAFLLETTSPPQEKVIVLWAAQMTPPAPDSIVEIQGQPARRDDLKVLNDVPVAFEKATHIFLVSAARPSWH